MTKKLFTLLLAVAAGVGTMFANGTKIGNLHYNLDATNQTAEVTSSIDKYSGAIVIPSSVTFNGRTYSVTSIGVKAFYYCTGLTSVTIGNSVTSIGDQAFRNCTGLTSVIWNAKNCAYNTAPFNNISSQITSFTFGNKVEHIPAGLCSGMSNLTSVTIPNSVTSIGSSAFYKCSGLTSVTIPNSVTSIGDQAFYYCGGLTSVTIPNSVTSIGDDAFFGCSGLTSPVYNAHVFAYMPTSYSGAYTIPDGIESIAGAAFSYCTLTSVTIPNSVTSIGKYAFSHSRSLTSVTIPNSVTSIEKGAFLQSPGLTSVTIGNSVTSIGDQTFYYCPSLTSVTIGNSVTSIGYEAFCNCIGLTSVTIPNSVNSIGGGAFHGCTGLTSVTIPNSVTSIGREAFYGCSGLTSVTIEAETPPTLGNSGAFYDFNNCPIYVPCGTLDAYKTAWTYYASRIQYVPFVFVVTGLVTETMMGRVVVPTTLCDDTLITAVPNYGYHFTQWSDGNTDNPRTIVLTQDTTFTAEFAKNTYTISTTSANPEWGTTAGDTKALYLDEVEVSATPNYGYHFVKWDIEKYQEHIEYGTLHMVKFSVPNTWSNPYAWIWETGASGHWETLSNENGMYVYRTIQSNMNIIIVPNGPSWRDGQTNDLAITESCCYTISGEYDVNNRYVTIKKYDCFSTDEQTIIDKLGTITYVDTTIITNTTNPLSLLVTQNQKAIAYFAKNTYTLSLTTNNPVMGQVEGAGVYGYNTQVNCVAVPYDGYEFVSWDNGIKDNPYILTITEDITLMAMFQPIGEGLFDTKEQASSPRKVLENGQLFILRGEKVYTVTGQEVK